MKDRFKAVRYRQDDVGSLEYRVICDDVSQVRVMAEALTSDDAQELADAMNTLDRKFIGGMAVPA